MRFALPLLRPVVEHRLHDLVVAGEPDRLVDQRRDVGDGLQPLDDRVGVGGVDHEHRLGVLAASLGRTEDDLAVVQRPPGQPVARAEDAQGHVPVPGRVPDRVPHLADGGSAQHEPRCAAAQVAGGVAGVARIARLDRLRREGRGEPVVVDTRPALGQRGRAPDPAGGRDAAYGAGRCDPLAHRGDRLRREAPQRVGVVAHHDERADALLKRQADQVVGALARGDVQQPRDLPGVAARRRGGLVDDLVAAPQVPRLQVGERGQPPVRLAADEPEHPRLVGAHPDGDLVSGRGAALRPGDAVVVALHAQRSPVGGVPDAAYHVDCLVECVYRLPGLQPPSAHRLDRVPEAPGPDPQAHPAARQQVQARRRPREDGGLAKRQVEHVA